MTDNLCPAMASANRIASNYNIGWVFLMISPVYRQTSAFTIQYAVGGAGSPTAASVVGVYPQAA